MKLESGEKTQPQRVGKGFRQLSEGSIQPLASFLRQELVRRRFQIRGTLDRAAQLARLDTIARQIDLRMSRSLLIMPIALIPKNRPQPSAKTVPRVVTLQALKGPQKSLLYNILDFMRFPALAKSTKPGFS